MTLRPFTIHDAPIILSWIKDKTAFRKWSADRYPVYPPNPEDMLAQYDSDAVFPYTAIDDEGNVVGHIMLRYPDPSKIVIRLGFVIVDDQLRGKGYGKQMLQLAIQKAKEEFGAKKITLGVFDNNPSAFHCYKSVGFIVTGSDTYLIDGEEWMGIEMEILDRISVDNKQKMETERILLRPWQESDAETLYKYASDPEVGPRAGWPPHKSVEESLEIIRTVFNTEGMWAVIWKESGKAIGCVGYLPASASNLKITEDQAEVGYWIARPFWGKGICTEALKMVIDYCFNEKGFTMLWGDYFPSNPASGRVMEKCGFVDTGEETLCPNLEVGSDRPVKVMRLCP